MPVLRRAAAATVLPSGGGDFDTAVAIEPGIYVTDHEIAQNAFEYFKISVEAGQGLTVKVTTPAGEYPYAGVIVYDPNQAEVGSQVIIGDSLASKTLTWLRSYEDSSIFYVAVGNEYDANAVGTTYTVSVDDYYDADSQTDAGGTFDTAFELDSAGTYQGYVVSEYGGTDEVDLYRLRFARGVEVTVTATPPSNATLGVAIYNNNREELAEGYSANDGAIAAASLSEPLASAGDLYIEVHAKYETTEEPIAYTLKISTTEGTTTNGDTSDDDTSANGDAAANGDATTGKGETTGGPNWTLVGAGVAGLILAGVLALTFLKKGSAGSPPREESTPLTGSTSKEQPASPDTSQHPATPKADQGGSARENSPGS